MNEPQYKEVKLSKNETAELLLAMALLGYSKEAFDAILGSKMCSDPPKG